VIGKLLITFGRVRRRELRGPALDPPEDTRAGIATEVVNLEGRLDDVLDRLAGALDPVLGATCR
jgi:hypothetical protein